MTSRSDPRDVPAQPDGLAGAPVFCSWSGGKDSAMALYEAGLSGAEPRLLVTMMTEAGDRSRSHGLSRMLLEEQAAAVGVPIAFAAASWPDYEAAFAAAVRRAVAQGARAGVFGDIDIERHRRWVESIAACAGSLAYLPLWKRSRASLMRDLLAVGFRAMIVAVRDGVLPPSLLGTVIDESTLDQLRKAGVDLAGEGGEYHTFVTDGPIFQRPLSVTVGEKSLRDGVRRTLMHSGRLPWRI